MTLYIPLATQTRRTSLLLPHLTVTQLYLLLHLRPCYPITLRLLDLTWKFNLKLRPSPTTPGHRYPAPNSNLCMDGSVTNVQMSGLMVDDRITESDPILFRSPISPLLISTIVQNNFNPTLTLWMPLMHLGLRYPGPNTRTYLLEGKLEPPQKRAESKADM